MNLRSPSQNVWEASITDVDTDMRSVLTHIGIQQEVHELRMMN